MYAFNKLSVIILFPTDLLNSDTPFEDVTLRSFKGSRCPSTTLYYEGVSFKDILTAKQIIYFDKESNMKILKSRTHRTDC